jgi:hypothetical protein
MIRGPVALAFATVGVCWLLWFQASHEFWYPHIAVDPVVYWSRATSFHEQGGSWAALGMNEYQPGALWFFAALMALAGGKCSFEQFFPVLLMSNALLLAAHVALARVFVSIRAAWLILLFAVLVGPILFCRFELLVSLLVLLGWLFWRRGWFLSAGVLLGAATATKVYPVLLVPLLLMAAWREGRWSLAASGLFGWAVGGFFVAGAFGLFGGEAEDIWSALQFHFDKPFGVEGMLGSGIPLLQGLLGIPLRLAPRNGIHGFESDLGALPTFLLEWCWLPVFAAVGWAVLRLPRDERCAAPGALFVLFGWYVLLGKLTAPQYAWWALPFLALAPAAWMTRGEWRWVIALLAASLVLAQIVYPLNYSEFLECFRGDYLGNRIFRLNLLKNLLWLLALLVASRALWRAGERAAPSAAVAGS